MWRSFCFGSAVLVVFSLFSVPLADAADEGPSGTPGKTKKVGVWFPPADFYPRYVADPIRPQNALTVQWVGDTEVPETGGERFGLRLGGGLGIFRWHPEGKPDIGWQLSFEGGFAGQFDIEHEWDNTGWDGYYGIYLSRMLTPDLGFRIGTQHNSSHLGDEYAERTGRKRIDYTRQEVAGGVAWTFKPKWTLYSELGWGRGISDTKSFRLESGLQYITAQRFWKGRASRYTAIDIRTYEETDWSTRVTAQVGYWIPVGDRSSVHRLAIEFGNGRSVMGQFLWEKETWIGIGWYFDW